jgi:hypothetical protein
LIAWICIPKARISRAVATPTLPKPRIPHTPPRIILLELRWLKSPRFRLSCSMNRAFRGGERQRRDVLRHRLGA